MIAKNDFIVEKENNSKNVSYVMDKEGGFFFSDYSKKNIHNNLCKK
jgi:hypothetical protein